MKLSRLVHLVTGLILTLHCFAQKKIDQEKINGYCIYTFLYDSVTQCYYPKKSVFIDSVTRKEFSLIKTSNITSYSFYCGHNIDVPILVSDPYLNLYSFTRDSARANVFLEGDFYENPGNNHTVYAVFKFRGGGLVINKACKDYRNDHSVNNWNVKHATICPDFLKLPQVYLNTASTAPPLAENELSTLQIKKSAIRKIRYCECI